jgi:hypothetical protein
MADRNATEQEVLATNDAFYLAFSTGDYTAMEGLWAESVPASCVHPGWPPVRGRDKVMQTWRGILANPPRPAIRALEAEATVTGDSAFVVCFEAIGELYLVATNFYIREGNLWRIVHHQSGQTERSPKIASEQSSSTIH